MQTFEITAPDGSIYEIDAPDDATPEQVQAYFSQNYNAAQPAAPEERNPTLREQNSKYAREQNKDNTFVENVGRGVAAGVTGRGVGILNTVYDMLKATGAISPEAQEIADEAFTNTASRVKNWSEGTKVGGAIGELADPVNLILGGPGGLVRKAAMSGALSAATAPSERRSSVGTRLTNAAVGGATGAAAGKALPIIAKPAAYGAGKLGQLLTRAEVLMGSRSAADKVVLQQAIRDAMDSGLTPEQAIAKVQDLADKVQGRSLAEALLVPKMFHRERNVFQSNTPAARKFIESINASNANALRPEASALAQGFDNADPLYKAAEKEFAASKLLRGVNAQDAVDPVRIDPYGLEPPPVVDPSRFTSQTGDMLRNSGVGLDDMAAAEARGLSATPVDEELARMLEGVRARSAELAGVKGDPEAAVLPLIEQRLTSAQGRGLDFRALQELRQQLRTLFIEGADEATASRANAVSSKVADDVGAQLTKDAPSLAAADAQFKRGVRGKALMEALDNSRGNLLTLKGKLPAPGQDRTRFLEGVPEAGGERQKVAGVIDAVEKLADTGYGGGIKTPRTGQLTRAADESTLGFDTGLVRPLGFMQRVARHISEKIQPAVYSAQADFSLGGNASANKLAEGMRAQIAKDAAGSPVGRGLNKAISAESGQAVTTTGPYAEDGRPQNGLTPIANSLLGLFGVQDAVAPKKKQPLKLTITPEPQLPPVDLPGPY